MNPTNKSGAAKNFSAPLKQPLSLATPQKAPNANLVFMNCGDFGLLLPGDEIVSLAPAQKLIAQPRSVHDCGYIMFEQQPYPVFCFNKALQLQSSLKGPHNMIVLFNHRGHCFGVSCYEIKKIIDSSTASSNTSDNLVFHQVPRCMSSRKQPFTEFAIFNNRAAGLTSASSLFTLIRLRGAKLHPTTRASANVLQGAG